MKFVSWNLDGINAVLRKSNFMNNLLMWKADIYAFQETKTLARDIRIVFPSYHDYWSFHTTNKLPSPQSGVVTVSKWKAIKQFTSFPQAPDFDTEGRLLVLEYDFFYFVNVYVPQSQDAVAGKSTERSMNRREYRAKFDRLFRDYMISLNKVKPVIIGGDFNASISSLDMSSNSRWQDEGFMKDANNQLLKLTENGFKDAVFENFYKDPEYEESNNSIKLLMELSDTDTVDNLENNPLYQYFSAAEKKHSTAFLQTDW